MNNTIEKLKKSEFSLMEQMAIIEALHHLGKLTMDELAHYGVGTVWAGHAERMTKEGD